MKTVADSPGSDARRPRGRRLPTRLRADDGMAMVEFALVLPVLLAVLTGILQFGLMFNKYISLTDAARAGARQIALSRGQTGTNPCTAEETTLENNEPTLNLTSANFPTPTFSNAADNCSNPGSWNQGDTVTFTIHMPYTFKVYGINLGTTTLTAQVTDAIE
jgi:Flp pilus assembly protein TadG